MEHNQQFGCANMPPYPIDSSHMFYTSHDSQYAYCNQNQDSFLYPYDCPSHLPPDLTIRENMLANVGVASRSLLYDFQSYLNFGKSRANCAYSKAAVQQDDTPTPTRFLKLIEAGEYSPDHEQHVSPFDHQFRRVTDDSKYDNLSLAIAKDAKDAKYLNEMVPNGLPMPNLPEHPYGSNISTSSTSTYNGGGSLNDLASDAPFPNCHLPSDDKLTLVHDYGAEVVTREDVSNITANRLIQANQKASSSDSLQSDSISTTANSAQDMNMSMMMSDTPIKKKRGRKPIMDEDPVEKRKRYLERNRAAATRCRNKKKVWVSGLEDRLNQLSDSNQLLKRENTLLRNELSKFSLQLHSVNTGLDGDQEGHDRLTGYLSAATINSPSISQGNILSHSGLILPMAPPLNSGLYPGLDARSHITPSTQ